jgi:DNA processing protein
MLEKIPGIGKSIIQNIESEREPCLEWAEIELKNLEKEGGCMFHYLEKDFPSRLKLIPDCPVVLFGKGSFNFENPKILAIVGTRQATNYGKKAIEQFLEELLPFKPVIVSGLAYGIDIFAHKTSIQLGLENWGIMATGVDDVYPFAHKSTAHQMQDNGGILTENLLQTKPDAPRFPARNRIIAGLSDAIWVVEAMEKGGAQITARLGSEYFRDVFALPGNINQKSSSGCNNLIQKNMAAVVTSGIQLAESMGWQIENGIQIVTKTRQRPEGLTNQEHQILDLLQLMGEIMMDEIAWRTQIPINELASQLLTLEFSGLVKSLPGKRFGLSK